MLDDGALRLGFDVDARVRFDDVDTAAPHGQSLDARVRGGDPQDRAAPLTVERPAAPAERDRAVEDDVLAIGAGRNLHDVPRDRTRDRGLDAIGADRAHLGARDGRRQPAAHQQRDGGQRRARKRSHTRSFARSSSARRAFDSSSVTPLRTSRSIPISGGHFSGSL